MNIKIKSGLILSTIALVSTALFINCNDTKEEIEYTNFEKATTASELVIAKCTRGSNTISLLFDKDSVIAQVETEASRQLMTNVIIDDILIHDSIPNSLTSAAIMEVSCFLSAHGIGGKSAIILSKSQDSTTGDIIYKLSSNPRISVTCESTNCAEGGCSFVWNNNGIPIDCTACGNDKGTCKKTLSSTPGESIWERIVKIFAGLLKINLNFNI